MSQPRQPVANSGAIANRQSAASKSFWLTMLMVAGGVAAAAGVGFVIADITAKPAWIALLVGGGLAVVGGMGARKDMKRVRYRIAVDWGGLWLALISAGAIALVWAAGSVHLVPRGLAGRMIFPVALAAVVFYLSTSTRFSGDCYGLRFRKTMVGWRDISQVVFTAGSKPGTVEIGARSAAGSTPNAMAPRAGEVLTDLPFRTVVSQRKFDLSRMCWVLDQSERQDISLIERTAAGEQVRARARTQ